MVKILKLYLKKKKVNNKLLKGIIYFRFNFKGSSENYRNTVFFIFKYKIDFEYLMKGLLDVTCKTVANFIKGKTPEEIRKTFNIKNDFTTSEEEQVIE